MDESFHPHKLVAGPVGIAGWRPWSFSHLVIAIFSDTGSLTSGLSFFKVPGESWRGAGKEGAWRELDPWRRGPGDRVSSALRWGRGPLVSNRGHRSQLSKGRDSACLGCLPPSAQRSARNAGSARTC